MDEFAAIVLFVFFVLIIPPVVIVIIVNQLRRKINSLSSQFSDLSRKMQRVITELEENQKKENVRSHAVPAPDIAPSTTAEIVSPEMTVKESIMEESSSPVFEEEKPILAEEEILIEPIGINKQPDPIIEIEKKTCEYATEEKVIEETLFFDINKPAPVTKQKKPGKQEKPGKEGLFSSQFWGENLLSKIGIITFVLGIAFFVKYAIDQNWINEIGRVGIGLLTGIAIIGVGHKLRKQYDVFSSILAGGGFAVFYITITLAFREYELIPQPLAFALLVMVTIACVVLSVFYDKKELALFSLLGGFSAPFLVSTGTGSYIVLFSYILILNTGMIWLAFRKGWHIIGTVSFTLSQLVIWSWLISSFTNQYGGVILFLLLFFIQFHILVVADHLRKRSKFTAVQAVILLANNVSLFAGGIFIFRDYPTQLNGLITMGLAVLNAVTLITIFRDKRIDKSLKYLLIATILSFVTLAIPLQLQGHAITLLWSAEIVIVLVLWLRSGMNLFRFGLYGIIGLALFSYLLDIGSGYEVSTKIIQYQGNYETIGSLVPLFLNRYFITGIALFICCIASAWLLKKELNKELPTPENRIHRKHISKLFYFFYVSIYVVLFIVLYVELYNQLIERMTYSGSEDFHVTTLATYFCLFVAMTLFLNRRKLEKYSFICGILLGLLGIYATMYFYYIVELRETIYLYGTLPASCFYVHLLSLVAVGYLIWQVWQYSIRKEILWRTRCVWILIVLSVIIITRESDNLAIMAMGNKENYFQVLRDLHTFGYPILWGILAMCLMIGGLKKKDIVLRKISLVFFAFIIVKFYLYDVWQMSQGGRIVSFVVLGLILLVVSFMQQRIRKLVKKDANEDAKTEDL